MIKSGEGGEYLHSFILKEKKGDFFKRGGKTHNRIMKKGIKSGNIPSVEPYSNESIN